MSESNIDDKEVIEESVAKKPKATKKPAAKKPAAKKATVAKADDVILSKADSEKGVTAKQEEKEDHRGEYFAAAAAVMLVAVLTVVTFFDKEFDSLVASITDTAAEVDVTVSEVVADQIAQPEVVATETSYGYQPFAKQPQAMSFEEMRNNQRAAREEAMRKHNERVAQSNQLRNATFERMDQKRIDMQNRMETMRVKTQQIQLEMQQKMQAAYNEFHAI